MPFPRARGAVVRLQGPAGNMSGPLLFIGKWAEKKLIKIFYEDTPLICIRDFDESHEELAIQMFIDVAKDMSRQEAANGPMTMEQARSFAAKRLGERILSGLKAA